MSEQGPRPTDAETAILSVLWLQGPCTVRRVHEALTERGTGYTTVLKLMQIMASKGLVVRDESKRTHVYTAALPQARVQARLAADLAARAFAGSTSQLVLRALQSGQTSADELQEIRAMLDRLEAGQEDAS